MNENNIKIKFLKKVVNLKIEVKLQNYRKKINDEWLIFFIDSYIFATKKSFFHIFGIIIFFLFLFFILKILFIFILPKEKIYKHLFFIFLFSNIVLFLFYIGPIIFEFRTAISEKYFYFFQTILIFCIGSLDFLKLLFKSKKRIASKNYFSR